MITILHHGMNNAFPVNYNLDIIIRHIKQVVCFDYLKALVHHGCGINRNAPAHIPVGMMQSLPDSNIYKLLTAAVTKASPAGRNDQLVHLTHRIALQALKNSGMLGINRIQRNAVLL